MRNTQSFDIKKKENGQKIAIYGAGRYGTLAYYGLKALDIIPDVFIDDVLAGQKKYGIDIISSQCLRKYENEIILIASYNYFGEMLQKAQHVGCKNIYDIETLLSINYDENVLDEYLKDEKHNPGKYHRVVENCGYEGLVVNHLELVVTECCSLRCRDCANLMQYYNHPSNLEMEEIYNSFDRFLNVIDLLLELRILGGEPFIVKDLYKVIDRYVKCEKIKKITIYTNGTIIPNERILKSLQKCKVSVHISNYGKIKSKVNELSKLFDNKNINYYIHEYNEWYDVGYPRKYNYNEEQIKKLYKSCTMAKCYTFYRGNFYVCPREAHGERLGFFQNDKREYVDFRDERNIEDNRNKLLYIMEELEYIKACRYCKGSSYSSLKIPAAIQKNKCLDCNGEGIL